MANNSWPLISTGIVDTESGSYFETNPSKKRATRSWPTMGREAALTLPPPSLVNTTSGDSTCIKASIEPPCT
ncbi:MAG: hypothetical protein WA880_12760, partial [Ornithinimicrobium sp.]